MLIWKGHGILILVFGVIGAVAGGMLGGTLFAATHWAWLGRVAMCAPFWGAAAAVWLYAKTMGKPTEKTYLDPATHHPVVIRSSHSFFFIPPVPWAILATLLACIFSLFAVVAPSSTFDLDASSASSAGGSAFDQANRLISMDKGQEAHGNTPVAEKMAADFAQMVKLGRQMGVQAGKKSAVSLSHGKFLTYCRLNADSCVFMVHVPDLRKFSKDAKEYIAEVAWSVAMASASELQPQPKRLAIGIRGAFLYDTVIEGHFVPEDKDAEEGIEQRHTGSSPQKHLEPYFEETPVSATLPKPGPLPKPAPKDEPEPEPEPEKKTATTPQPAPAGGPAVSAASSPQEKLEVLLKWFPTTKAGEVGGNTKAVNQLALFYASKTHGRVSTNPALGGVSLPDPCFSAYIHLRDDTAAFFLALPAGSDLSEGAMKVVQNEAMFMAAMISAQMSPLPARIAVTTFNEGQMDQTSIGLPQNPEGTEWRVEQQLSGNQAKDALATFLGASSKPLITMKPASVLKGMVVTVKSSILGANPAKTAPPPVAATPPAPAPASAPSLPTAVRDWKDATGRVMQASLESFTTPAKDTGRFKRADGQAFEVPFSRLSAEDQGFIRKIAEQP